MTTLKQVSVETGIAIKDLIESKTATGKSKFSVKCPDCGRKRLAEMAILGECPGPFDGEKSVGGCGSEYFTRPDIKKRAHELKNTRLGKLQEWVKKKGGEEKMGFIKAEAVRKEKVVKKQSEAPKKVTIKGQILEAHKKGLDFDKIAKQVDRSRAYVVSTIGHAKSKK